MKRLLCVVLALVFLSAPAMAEGLDLAGMDFESLMQLKQAVDAELYSRSEAEPRVLQPGLYVVGRDIRPGSYLAIIGEMSQDAWGSEILVYRDRQAKDDLRDMLDLYINVDDSPVDVILEDGNYVEICHHSVRFSISGFENEDYLRYTLPDGTLVPAGIYIVGEDIPCGRYLAFAGTIAGGELKIYNTKDAYISDGSLHLNYDQKFEIEASGAPNGYALRFDEGNVVLVEQDVVMRKQAKIEFD